MTPQRRPALRPLAKPEAAQQFRALVPADELIAEIRAHFPTFEDDLRREFDVGFEIFRNDTRGSVGLIGVLVATARLELKRRLRFAAANLLRAGPRARTQDPTPEAERFAIQTEGTEPNVQPTPPTGRTRTPAPDHMAEPGRIPPKSSGT